VGSNIPRCSHSHQDVYSCLALRPDDLVLLVNSRGAIGPSQPSEEYIATSSNRSIRNPTYISARRAALERNRAGEDLRAVLIATLKGEREATVQRDGKAMSRHHTRTLFATHPRVSTSDASQPSLTMYIGLLSTS